MYLDIKKPKRISHRISNPFTPEATFILAFTMGVTVGWLIYYLVISDFLK